MAKTYKHKPIYLIAKENGEIKGVLPLFLMRSMIFGKKLVSVPFAPYGGVCADNKAIENALVEKPFFQKESFTKEILYFIHNEEAKKITKARLDARSKIAIITKAEKIRNRDIDV